MPCPHNEITIVQRSQRQSAVAAAAYQSGEKLFCEYDQQVKHYPEKRGIVHNEILLPANAPQKDPTKIENFRPISLMNIGAERIQKELEQKDRSRATYHRYFTQQEWGKVENYTLSLDSGTFTKTQCAELIIKAVEMKTGK